MRSPKQTTGSSADQLLTIANSIRDRQVSAPDFSLILMSNMAPQRQFEAIIRTLPRGVCVLYRDYLASERAQQAKELKRLCAERECPFLIAGDPELARAVQADGIHVPSWQLRHYQRWSGFRGIITAACHNVEQLRLAALGGADAVLISPVFQPPAIRANKPWG